MITSAPDALAFHEASIEEMWGRALKGQAAAGLVRHLLTSKHLPADEEYLTPSETPKRRPRTKPPALM
jgi:hypothetical protein